jgi:hypothetical protein
MILNHFSAELPDLVEESEINRLSARVFGYPTHPGGASFFP